MMRKARRPVWPVAFAATVLLALAGCGAAEAPGGTPSGHPSGVGENGAGTSTVAAQPMAGRDGTARVYLLAVDRSGANTVTVRWRVDNPTTRTLGMDGEMQRETGKFQPKSRADGISLVDAIANKRYFPLYDTAERCLCSPTDGVKLDPGQSAEFYAVLPAPPGGTRTIDVALPLTPMFQGVTIGTKPRPVGSGEIDPAKDSLKPADIVPLVSTVDGADQGTDDTDATRSIRLAADVLFAVDRSDLSPAAQTVLKQVARQIDASTSTTVTIDGYTDSTGNDAINNPLSVARAQSVQAALEGLVTRKGITFSATGHGSKDPVADNGTDEGRQRNRRVTVTFARPAPAPEAPATAAPAPDWTGGPLPVAGTATAQDPKQKNVKLEVNTVHRDATGLTTLTWTLTNSGSDKFGLGFTFVAGGQLGTYDGVTVSGVALVDPAANLIYRTLRDQLRGCLCTTLNSGRSDVDPGESVIYYTSYELPSGVASVTVTFPGFSAVANVPVR